MLVSNFRKNWIKITLLLASSMTVMAGATIAPALPLISKEFAHVGDIVFLSKLILTIPGFFIAFTAPIAGFIIDKLGRKTMMLCGLICYGIAGSTGLYLDDVYSILIGRAFLGLSVGAIMTTASTLLGDYLRGEERDKFVGFQGAFIAGGGVFFVLLGGFLADYSWRYPFALYLTAIALVPVAYFALYEPDRARPNGTTGQNDPAQDVAYSKQTVWFIYFLAFLVMTTFYMIPAQLPFWLRELKVAKTNLEIGAVIAIANLSGAVASFNHAKFKRIMDYESIYGIIFLAMAVGMSLISVAHNYWMVVAGVVVAGLGTGLTMPNTNLWLMSVAPIQLRGRIMGGVSAALFIGQFASPILSQPVSNYGGLGMMYGAFGGAMVLFAVGFMMNNLIKTLK
ncbi:MAG: MFS transporter [Cytophagales bacterium]|nr:MAG: MFS transporter [Cytophagales bacterium]TAF60664.1 MAG: MFS transporter [Cytophagales bacterium]